MKRSNFLIIQLRQIGDVVLTTPIPSILKKAMPDCRISFLTEPPSDQLLAQNPFIDELLLNNRKAPWYETLKLGNALRRKKFDVVIDFMGNPRSAILSFLSGAAMRISYPAKGRGILYTHNVFPTKEYAVEIKKRLLGPLGVQSDLNKPQIFLSDEELAQGVALRQKLLNNERKRLITVDPSHRRSTRRYPAEHYGALCGKMADNLDALPVVLWGPGEEALAERTVEASGGAAVKAPPTRLREMAALIAAADLHAGNCSAPRHIAVAVDTPTFIILGSTSSGWTHPSPEHEDIALGLDCQPCNANSCEKEMACLTGLSPEKVFNELKTFVMEKLKWKNV